MKDPAMVYLKVSRIEFVFANDYWLREPTITSKQHSESFGSLLAVIIETRVAKWSNTQQTEKV
jgi:hypothetical protein